MAAATDPFQATPAASLPSELTSRLLSEVDVLARRMTRRLADEVPLGPEFRSITYLRSVMHACRDGLGTLLRLLHDGRAPLPEELARLGEAGARQAELGVPLEVLLSAYRLAAKVVWQEVIGEAMTGADLSPLTTVQVTEHVLEYLDAISGAVGRSYLETRERRMRRQDRDRDLVLQRLLAGDVSLEMRRVASSHGLELTPPYRVLACSLADEDAEAALSAAFRRPGWLLAPDNPGRWILLLPPDTTAEGLTPVLTTLPALRIGIGPLATGFSDIAGAARQARTALRVGERLSPRDKLHHHGEFEVFGVLAAEPEAMRSFVAHTLGRLLTPTASRRGDLLHTLDVLLTTPSLTEAARALGLHRHTLVYRQQRLQELLEISLDDPSERHRLWLGLQCRRLLEP